MQFQSFSDLFGWISKADPQLIGFVIFIIALGIILLVNRKKLAVQKLVFPVLYVLMQRTTLGLRQMDTWAKRWPKTLRVMGIIGVVLGFIGMILMVFMLFYSIVQSFLVKEAPAAVGLVLPFKVQGGFYVPFFYWIICIFVIAVVHEFAHGVICRRYGIKVKSSGFAFLCVLLPVIPAAFVEPDEKSLKKKKPMQQLAMFAAGPFANVILAIIALGLLFLVFGPITKALVLEDGILISALPTGNVTYPAQAAGLHAGDVIRSIDGNETVTYKQFSDILSAKNPGDKIVVKTTNGTYTVTLTEHPSNKEIAYMGVSVLQKTKYKEDVVAKTGLWFPATIVWIFGLLYWLHVLNLGIGLFNLLPLGPLDGGRMMLVLLSMKFKEKKAQKIWMLIGLVLLIILIVGLFHSCQVL